MAFNPDVVPYILYDDIVMYAKVTAGRMIREGLAFGMWFVFQNPQFLGSPALTPLDLSTLTELRTHASTRAQFRALLDCAEPWPRQLD